MKNYLKITKQQLYTEHTCIECSKISEEDESSKGHRTP